MNIIYLLSDPITDEPRYVGITNNLKQRMSNHNSGRGRGHCRNWINSLHVRGLIPKCEVIDTVEDRDRSLYEMLWILVFRIGGANLTNLTMGGEGVIGYKHNSEAKTKISIGRTGWTHTAQAKTKMSEHRKGIRPSDEVRRRLSAMRIGRRHTPETKTRMRISAVNRWRNTSAEVMRQKSIAMNGNKLGLGNKSHTGIHHREALPA